MITAINSSIFQLRTVFSINTQANSLCPETFWHSLVHMTCPTTLNLEEFWSHQRKFSFTTSGTIWRIALTQTWLYWSSGKTKSISATTFSRFVCGIRLMNQPHPRVSLPVGARAKTRQKSMKTSRKWSQPQYCQTKSVSSKQKVCLIYQAFELFVLGWATARVSATVTVVVASSSMWMTSSICMASFHLRWSKMTIAMSPRKRSTQVCQSSEIGSKRQRKVGFEDSENFRIIETFSRS